MARRAPESNAPSTPLAAFLRLVDRVTGRTTARSENDLSSHLAGVLRAQGFHTVIDTSVSTAGRKRPDILGYLSQEDADLVLSAEIVVESKRPEEVADFDSLVSAMVGEPYWSSKTLPYLRDNIARVQYFAFTTFSEFAVFRVDGNLRRALVRALQSGDNECQAIRRQIQSTALSFNLSSNQADSPTGRVAWIAWLEQHLRPALFAPIALSEVRNSVGLDEAGDVERFAECLATFAAGMTSGSGGPSGLFHSVRHQLADTYQQLAPDIRRDLVIFVLAQHPGLSPVDAERLVQETYDLSIDDFVAASIHSLLRTSDTT